MQKADVVVVPSRESYAEGLPNIIYESLAMRTPLLLSNHPAFVDRLKAGQDAMFFQSANVSALTEAIAELLQDRSRLKHISDNSAAALNSLYVGIERTELIARFLKNPTNDDNWVSQICL
jgi:glycosyltransferase involved in cell wall biosynthesis